MSRLPQKTEKQPSGQTRKLRPLFLLHMYSGVGQGMCTCMNSFIIYLFIDEVNYVVALIHSEC